MRFDTKILTVTSSQLSLAQGTKLAIKIKRKGNKTKKTRKGKDRTEEANEAKNPINRKNVGGVRSRKKSLYEYDSIHKFNVHTGLYKLTIRH